MCADAPVAQRLQLLPRQKWDALAVRADVAAITALPRELPPVVGDHVRGAGLPVGVEDERHAGRARDRAQVFDDAARERNAGAAALG